MIQYWTRLYFLKPLPPFAQMRRRGSWYTCPYLMHVQWLVSLPWRRDLYWSEGGYLCETLPHGGGAQVQTWWPEWLIIAECCWHNRSLWSFQTWWRDREWRRGQERERTARQKARRA